MSRLRRAQAAATRTRILRAGSALAHEAPSWDWSALTFRAIALRAQVSDRTVYRYFATERELHEAVMRRLEQEAGVSYDRITLNDLAEVTSRVFASLPSFAVPPTVPRDETFLARSQVRRDSLLRAVSGPTADWPDTERQLVAAMLDVLWTPTTYERLIVGWGFDTVAASRAATWALEVLIKAIRSGTRPARAGRLGARTRKR